ncbi:mediator of RNA polymerase II transcription subunit 19-A isoform 1-T1 [Neosynchiropus ocellatus]
MTEIFSTLYGQNETQGPAGSSSLAFGPGKPPPPIPQNQVSVTGQMPPQLGDEGPTLRKPGAMNEPFYLLRELPVGNELTGNTNLITHYNLEHAYNKFCGKKVKEKLSNFLPELPGMIDCPGTQDGSSLRSLIDKPPVSGNSFSPLTGAMLTGFRLHTGPLPEQYRLMHIQPPKKKSKHKHKHHRPQDPLPQGEAAKNIGCFPSTLLKRSSLAQQKLHQTLTLRRRRRRGMTILTGRKRRKTRKRRRTATVQTTPASPAHSPTATASDR